MGRTEKQRQAARDRIYLVRPWQHSTGPRTEKGKRKVTANLVGGGGEGPCHFDLPRQIESAKLYLMRQLFRLHQQGQAGKPTRKAMLNAEAIARRIIEHEPDNRLAQQAIAKVGPVLDQAMQQDTLPKPERKKPPRRIRQERHGHRNSKGGWD